MVPSGETTGVALKRFFSGVLAHVQLELSLSCTLMTTDVATVRFEFIMNSRDVFLETFRVREDPVTNWTFLRRVPSSVTRRRQFCILRSVILLVSSKLFQLFEGLVASGTSKIKKWRMNGFMFSDFVRKK